MVGQGIRKGESTPASGDHRIRPFRVFGGRNLPGGEPAKGGIPLRMNAGIEKYGGRNGWDIWNGAWRR